MTTEPRHVTLARSLSASAAKSKTSPKGITTATKAIVVTETSALTSTVSEHGDMLFQLNGEISQLNADVIHLTNNTQSALSVLNESDRRLYDHIGALGTKITTSSNLSTKVSMQVAAVDEKNTKKAAETDGELEIIRGQLTHTQNMLIYGFLGSVASSLLLMLLFSWFGQINAPQQATGPVPYGTQKARTK
jgi:TolA-binding protein